MIPNKDTIWKANRYFDLILNSKLLPVAYAERRAFSSPEA